MRQRFPVRKWQGMALMTIWLLLEPVSIYCSFTSASDRLKCSASRVTSPGVTLIMSERQQLPQLVQSICGVMVVSSSCTSRSMLADPCERRNTLNAWFSASFFCAANAITLSCVMIFKPVRYAKSRYRLSMIFIPQPSSRIALFFFTVSPLSRSCPLPKV